MNTLRQWWWSDRITWWQFILFVIAFNIVWPMFLLLLFGAAILVGWFFEWEGLASVLWLFSQ